MSSIDLTLKIWRQKNNDSLGNFETYILRDISTDMSFLEMIDVLNEQLTREGKDPVAFDHDCREGICGMCGAVVDGVAHGPDRETTLCQLHMRKFSDGETLVIEAGGYVSVNTGGTVDGNSIPIGTETAELAMDAAACIGCGACVASCPNSAAMLFTGAKISQLSLLPQGLPERKERARSMVAQMDKEGFGYCSNEKECEAVCPKGISIRNIARMNREFLRSLLLGE